MKILLTGGAGFIGAHLCKKLLENKHQVFVLDNLSNSKRHNIPTAAHFIAGDITDSTLWKQLPDTDIIIHLAALISVAESMNDPVKCQQINVNSFFPLLEYAQKTKCQKIIFASSAAVYGNNTKPKQKETDLVTPQSFYGLSKLNGEHILNIFYQKYGIPFVAFRMFNVFGPGQSPDSDYASVIPSFIKNCLQDKPLQIHGDGQQKRDFIYVRQVIEYYYAAMESPFIGICNIGNGTSIDILRLSQTILNELKNRTRSTTVFTPPRLGDIRCSLADTSRLRKEFNNIEKWDFQLAIQETTQALVNTLI